jgi:biotin carboxylase
MAIDTFVLFGGVSSSEQAAFIAALRLRSMQIVVIDEPDAEWNGIAPPDVTDLRIQPHQLGELLEALKKVAKDTRIAGIFNTSEVFVEAAALTCELLGLPGPGLRAAKIARSKALQRCVFEDVSPPFVCTRAGQAPLDFPHFPAVLKPLDRSGGSGVRVITEPLQLAAAQREYAPNEPLLLEKFVAGIDLSVESLIHRGTVVFQGITEEADSPPGKEHLELGYTLPMQRLSQAQRARLELVHQNVLASLRVGSGFVHAEYRASGDQVFLMELAVRVPGDGLLEMYELSTGERLENAVLECALGRLPQHPRAERFARQLYFEVPGGLPQAATIKGTSIEARFRGDPPLRSAGATLGRGGVRSLRLHLRRGEPPRPLQSAVDRHGSVVFDAATLDELELLDQHVRNNLEISTKGGTVRGRFY